MKVEQVTSRGSISRNELSGQMSSEGEGLVHKSKTAKDSEVVGEGDGVIPSALMGRKPSKATSKKWQAKQTEKNPHRSALPLLRKELRGLQTARVYSASDREVGSNLKLNLLI